MELTLPTGLFSTINMESSSVFNANQWFSRVEKPSIGTSDPSITPPASTIKAYWTDSAGFLYHRLSSSSHLRKQSQQFRG